MIDVETIKKIWRDGYEDLLLDISHPFDEDQIKNDSIKAYLKFIAEYEEDYIEKHSGWVSVDSVNLKEGDRWLCVYRGNQIVLELGEETPSYEETFKPYLYWFEPYSDMLTIEWHEISYIHALLPIPTDKL